MSKFFHNFLEFFMGCDEAHEVVMEAGWRPSRGHVALRSSDQQFVWVQDVPETFKRKVNL